MEDKLRDAAGKGFQFDDTILIEQYVSLGREYRIGITEKENGTLDMLSAIEHFFSVPMIT